MPNGETKIHNIITEGFVEATARAMIRAIKPQVMDIDEEKYPEYVEMANRVISSRDISLGQGGQGQTYADFLMHSSVLKRDLESRTVALENGSKVDGLHYISDYADEVQQGKTRKRKFYKEKDEKLKLSDEQKNIIMKLVAKRLSKQNITLEEQTDLMNVLNVDNPELMIEELVDIIREEQAFFNGIAEKLGYTDRTIDEQKPTQEIVQESIKGVPDLTVLDDIEQVQARQQRAITNQRESKENTQNI